MASVERPPVRLSGAPVARPAAGQPGGDLLRNLGVYLIYVAVLVRTVLILGGEPGFPAMLWRLLAYGALLLGSLSLQRGSGRRWRLAQALYLLAQSALILSFRPESFKQDIFAILFIPLSMQAVLFFGRREGFLWIAAFCLASTVNVLLSWQGQLTALAQVALYAGACIFTGSYAYLIRETEATRQRNRRLLGELKLTFEQLQEYGAQAEAYAALQERQRMARELHDSATQTIFSMNLAAQAAQLLAGKDRARLLEQLDRLQALASSAVSEIQTLSNQLRPEPAVANHPAAGAGSPPGVSLSAALQQLAAERLARDGLQVQLELGGERALDPAVAAGLYRIAQEALTNVAKHAGMCQVQVRLRLDVRPSRLEIADAGRGFDLQVAGGQSGHLGLQSMAERAQEIGWTLRVESSPGQGTLVCAEERAAEVHSQ